MAFEDKKDYAPKIGMKQVEGQKSMFEGKPRKQTQQEFQQKIQGAQEQSSEYKQAAADLYSKFLKILRNKTLSQNKSMIDRNVESEVLLNLIRLAQNLNVDPNERESEGSLTLVIILLKTCLEQNERINELEYNMHNVLEKLKPAALVNAINKENSRVLDTQKISE